MDLPAHLVGHLRKPWHSYTATEITIPCAGNWAPSPSVLTARPCEQPVSWDGRAVYTTPLHLAVSADKDHPDCLWGFRTRPLVLTWALCGSLVFTDKTAEDGPTH